MLREWLAHHIGQHGQAAAVGHAHNKLFHAQLRAALDDLFQPGSATRRLQGQTALCPHSVGREIARTFRLGQALQDVRLAQRA